MPTARALAERIWWTGLVACAAAIAGALALEASQRQVTERRVIVAVTNRNGEPEVSLSPREFIVREDGIAREIVRVSPAPPPSHLVMLVDNSQALDGDVTDVRAALSGFSRAMAGGDDPPAVSVVTFGDRPTTVTPFVASSAPVQASLGGLFPRIGSGARFLDAIIETTQDLQKRRAERPLIVAFVIEDGEEFSDVSHAQVNTALREANASLWSVVLQAGVQSNGPPARERAVVLGDGTRMSGGRTAFVLSSQGLAREFTLLAAQLQARYEVVYGRPDSLIAPTRLEVTMRSPALVASAAAWVNP